jgi:hypothetical protein
MPLDLNRFKNADGAAEPPDGEYSAALREAHILDTKRGTQLKLTFETGEFWWQSWEPVDQDPRDAAHARSNVEQLLAASGKTLNGITTEGDLANALAACEGRDYQVVTESRQGTGRVFVTSTVLGPVAPELPIDTRGLPQPAASTDEETIPF